MARISNEAKTRYTERIKEYKASVDAILKKEAEILASRDDDGARVAYGKLELADITLDTVSYYILMNSLSAYLLGMKNEAHLNAARKACYKSIIYLEDTVSSVIDGPFSDYEERLSAIEEFDDASRHALLKKLGFSIRSIIDGFGENSKWKWSFVEIEGKFATVAKNLLDLKNLVSGMDPRSPGYESRTAHLALAKQLLQQSADSYRQKYELSTHRIDDFKLAINYLSGLRRLHIVLGDAEQAQELKKKTEIWRAKMESDSKKIELRQKASKRKSARTGSN